MVVILKNGEKIKISKRLSKVISKLVLNDGGKNTWISSDRKDYSELINLKGISAIVKNSNLR